MLKNVHQKEKQRFSNRRKGSHLSFPRMISRETKSPCVPPLYSNTPYGSAVLNESKMRSDVLPISCDGIGYAIYWLPLNVVLISDPEVICRRSSSTRWQVIRVSSLRNAECLLNITATVLLIATKIADFCGLAKCEQCSTSTLTRSVLQLACNLSSL